LSSSSCTQARNEVGANTFLVGARFFFLLYVLIKIFLGTTKFGETQKKLGERCLQIPFVATGLAVLG